MYWLWITVLFIDFFIYCSYYKEDNTLVLVSYNLLKIITLYFFLTLELAMVDKENVDAKVLVLHLFYSSVLITLGLGHSNIGESRK